ncbi:MAG: exo-alpha-sialidase [Bryobacterales bacterium]|nr:exo-alpha-sialidase [Bryobacterales bacterium]
MRIRCLRGALCLWFAAVLLVADESRMLAVAGLPEDPSQIDFTALPRVPSEEITVFAGVKDESAYNNHAYLEFFGGQFFAMWSMHPTNGNYHGMHVLYATSADGKTWSKPGRITPVPEGKRYVARGFWARDGRLLALASLDSGAPKKQPHWAAADLELMAFAWNPRLKAWAAAGRVYDDTINNFPPVRLPGGDWMMARRDYQSRFSLMLGGVKAINHWRIGNVPNPEMRSFTEPDVIVRPDGMIAMHIRDGGGSRRLYRAVSKDGGQTWSAPVQTNFPDATSKNFNLRLSNGIYVLISNSNPKGRVPLTIATSRDAKLYERLLIVEDAPGAPRIAGHDKGRGYTYPHAIERNGFLYVSYAKHRDDIVIRRIRIDALAGERKR